MWHWASGAFSWSDYGLINGSVKDFPEPHSCIHWVDESNSCSGETPAFLPPQLMVRIPTAGPARRSCLQCSGLVCPTQFCQQNCGCIHACGFPVVAALSLSANRATPALQPERSSAPPTSCCIPSALGLPKVCCMPYHPRATQLWLEQHGAARRHRGVHAFWWLPCGGCCLPPGLMVTEALTRPYAALLPPVVDSTELSMRDDLFFPVEGERRRGWEKDYFFTEWLPVLLWQMEKCRPRGLLPNLVSETSRF